MKLPELWSQAKSRLRQFRFGTMPQQSYSGPDLITDPIFASLNGNERGYGEATYIRGQSYIVCSGVKTDGISNLTISCRNYNSINVTVYVVGGTPSATISIVGVPYQGQGYVVLSTVNSVVSNVSGNTSYDVAIGTPNIKIRISDISFVNAAASSGYMIIVTPFNAPSIVPNVVVDSDNAASVAGKGTSETLLTSTAFTGNSTDNHTAITGLDKYTIATILLNIVSENLTTGTLDVSLQYSWDGGVHWDDLAAFAQITSAASMGYRVIFLNTRQGPSLVDRATTGGTLAANSVRQIDWCDRMRVRTKSATMAVGDTVTVEVVGYFK